MDAFLTKSVEMRALEIRAKQEADPVEYACKASCEVLCKSAGTEQIAMAKQLDVQQTQIEVGISPDVPGTPDAFGELIASKDP